MNTVSTATLNKIATLLNTTDKNTVLTYAVGTLVKSGVDIKDAMDAVFGEGAYMKLAEQVYHQLRGEA